MWNASLRLARPVTRLICQDVSDLTYNVDRVLTYRIVSTDTYHAMYRVLEAFSLFNTILGTSQCANCAVSCSLPTCVARSLGFSRLLVRTRAQAAFHGTPINVVLRCYVLSLVWQRQRLWVA